MNYIAEIDVTDELSPLFENFLSNNPRYFRALGKSVGWWYQKQIKEEIPEGFAGNVNYEERWSLELRRKLDPKAPKKFYGRMKQAIGYQFDNGVTKIGWTSQTSSKYGDLQEHGYNKFVTDRMRNYFRSVGINLSKNTRQLNIPARPIYNPINEELRPKVIPYINGKVQQYMEQGITTAKRSRRVYKVY